MISFDRAFAAAVVAICLWSARPLAAEAADAAEFGVPISYAGFGIAAQPVVGVELLQGAEAQTVSRLLVQAFQRLQHSIVEPDVSLESLLPPNRAWSTDIVPLERAMIDEYNRLHSALALPNDRIYGMQYQGEYRLEADELRFKLRSVLHHRGVGGAFRPYTSREYSSAFFFERARVVIQEMLAAASRADPK